MTWFCNKKSKTACRSSTRYRQEHIEFMADGHKGRTLQPSDTTRKIKYVSNRPTPDFVTSLIGWSFIIDYQLVISLFQQLMVTQLRIMEWQNLFSIQGDALTKSGNIRVKPPDSQRWIKYPCLTDNCRVRLGRVRGRPLYIQHTHVCGRPQGPRPAHGRTAWCLFLLFVVSDIGYVVHPLSNAQATSWIT